jgi:hypothetical protein
MSPEYLERLTNNQRTTNARQNLRAHCDYIQPLARTQQYYKSFIPTSIRLWNDISQDDRDSPSLGSFKHKLAMVNPKRPPYFHQGKRRFNIIHCQLRNCASNLQSHLKKDHLTDCDLCVCGQSAETNYHFFFECGNFTAQRAILTNKLDRFGLSLDLLLYGSLELSYIDNGYILGAVHSYIKDSNRFACH